MKIKHPYSTTDTNGTAVSVAYAGISKGGGGGGPKKKKFGNPTWRSRGYGGLGRSPSR